MGSFRWLLDLHLKRPTWFIYVLIAPILEVFLYLYPISLTANIIQQLLDGNLNSFTQTMVFLFFFAIFQAAIYFSLNFLNEVLAHRVTTDITQELFETVQGKSLAYHDQKDIGQIMARASGDTRTINMALSPGIVRVISLFTIWCLAIYIAAGLNPLLTVLTIGFFILYLFTVVRFTKERIKYSDEVLEQYSTMTEFSLRSISGIKEIKGFNAENNASSSFNKTNHDHSLALVKLGEKSAIFYPSLVSTIYASLMISIIVYFSLLNLVLFSDVVLFAGILIVLDRMSSGQQWQFRQIIGAIAAIKRIYTILNEEDPEVIEHGSLEPGDSASIEFKNVNFSYTSDGPLVFNNISFKIDDNQTIAIVGRPGSGKSTITKLIQRLYLPNSGQILIGGHPIEKYSNSSLRKFIATVEQDVFLFNKSLFENIRFGKPEATLDEVIVSAKLAHAHDFITQFVDSYETKIGEKGVRLSGGQAQRVSIARALLVNPSILLMDDGVSALDARTEIEIQNAISSILKTRTTVITTHRLAIISKADLVIILDKGKIMGFGSHRDLIRTNTFYRQLFEHHYELPPLEVSL